MSFNKVLESERLLYKPLESSYCNDNYLQWLNNKEINRYMGLTEPYTKEQLMTYLIDVEKNENILFWAVLIKEGERHIGNIKIDPVNHYHGLGEYGIMMGDQSTWGKGYATEASKTIIDYCFKEEGLRKITLGVVEENTSAVNLYKKLGFLTEGIYKKHGLWNGHYCDVLRMAIFNPDTNYEH